MTTSKIRYKEGYKYQLADSYTINTNLRPEESITTLYVALMKDGFLQIDKGYAWDGASGLAFDTKNFMRGSLVHDALYQLMREGCLAEEKWRAAVDATLDIILEEDGMSSIRRWWVQLAVRTFGKASAVKQVDVIEEAP